MGNIKNGNYNKNGNYISEINACNFCDGTSFHFGVSCPACDGTGKRKVQIQKQKVYNAKNDLPINNNI